MISNSPVWQESDSGIYFYSFLLLAWCNLVGFVAVTTTSRSVAHDHYVHTPDEKMDEQLLNTYSKDTLECQDGWWFNADLHIHIDTLENTEIWGILVPPEDSKVFGSMKTLDPTWLVWNMACICSKQRLSLVSPWRHHTAIIWYHHHPPSIPWIGWIGFDAKTSNNIQNQSIKSDQIIFNQNQIKSNQIKSNQVKSITIFHHISSSNWCVGRASFFWAAQFAVVVENQFDVVFLSTMYPELNRSMKKYK